MNELLLSWLQISNKTKMDHINPSNHQGSFSAMLITLELRMSQ